MSEALNKKIMIHLLIFLNYNYQACQQLGDTCAGIANLQCCSPFTCYVKETFPDAGGTCISVKH